MKFDTNLGQFVSHNSEWNYAKRHFMLKDCTFTLNPTHNPFLANFEWKCTDNSTELDISLQKVERYFNLVQNPTVGNRMP